MSKRKKKNNNLIIINIILLIILIIGIIVFVLFLNKKEDNKDDNKENDVVENIEPTPTPDPKLQELEFINEKLDFFKMDYVDRYIAYKNLHPELDLETVVVYVNIGLDYPFYENVVDSPYKYETTVLCNKHYYLGEDYVPQALDPVNPKYAISNDKYMDYEARIAFEEMAAAALSEGYSVKATSTYRSYSYQSNLYKRYAASDGTEKADTYSARAGYSEHQTGLAVDVSDGKLSYTKFGNTKEYKWMLENAYKYGFILRYTKENEFITGYMEEAWHYRYVGKEIAEYIQNHPMTYEEYYVRFLDK